MLLYDDQDYIHYMEFEIHKKYDVNKVAQTNARLTTTFYILCRLSNENHFQKTICLTHKSKIFRLRQAPLFFFGDIFALLTGL